MRKIFGFLIIILICSCSGQRNDAGRKVITVSIAPFKYFVEAIADDDFAVNVMVPSGANPHIYEPFPEQISKLRGSVAYISNGYLGFEMTWLDRFYETNKKMKRLSLAEEIDPLQSEHHHEGEHTEGADPHYWVSPKCALSMARSINELLCNLNPLEKQRYESNYQSFILKIQKMDSTAMALFSEVPNRSFMIFHPNLGYLARDYGLEEISVEFDGKEPSPSRMRYLIDLARERRFKSIFVQREYDAKNAQAIADEIGAKVEIIDPLGEDWMKTTTDIILALSVSLTDSIKTR